MKNLFLLALIVLPFASQAQLIVFFDDNTFSAVSSKLPSDYGGSSFVLDTYIMQDGEVVPFKPKGMNEDEFFIGRCAGFSHKGFTGETFVIKVRPYDVAFDGVEFTIKDSEVIEVIEVTIPEF